MQRSYRINENKFSGSDGLPVEFYKMFWDDIKSLLVESINSAYLNGEFSPTQKRGILNFIFKKKMTSLY